MKYEHRTSIRQAYDLNVLPAQTAGNAGTQRLYGSLFCGKAGGQAFHHGVSLALAIQQLSCGKDALEEAVTMAFRGLPHSANVTCINSRSHDHACSSLPRPLWHTRYAHLPVQFCNTLILLPLDGR